MKKLLAVMLFTAATLLSAAVQAQAGEMDVLLIKLVEKNVLTPAEAQIIADETKLQVTKDLSQGKSYAVPDWTQRIKWGGDVRFRTQGDWGKTANNQAAGSYASASPNGQGTSATNANDIRHQQIMQRVRGRFWMEGKVNDFTYSGVRFAGGGIGSRSTNDTLNDYFGKDPVEFDQYWMRFEAPSELIRDYGQYFSDLKLWAGRFNIPFEYSELVWDSDINPQGIALQYVSPDLNAMRGMPSFNVYSNMGMFWLEEARNYNTDPLLFGCQVGMKTEPFGPLDSVLNVATTVYDFANLQGKTPTNSAGTNTRVWNGDYNFGSTIPFNTLKYEYNVLDLLVTVDNAKLMGIEMPHGFYADYIHNAAAGTKQNSGYLLGGYLGKKKIKDKGDWKMRAEMRYIERDSIPDFMPDSDFYGFGTYGIAATALNTVNQVPNQNGLPAGGGTNGKGINMALEYQLFKNTALNFEYYWMEPIQSFDKTCPYNEMQIDVITKF